MNTQLQLAIAKSLNAATLPSDSKTIDFNWSEDNRSWCLSGTTIDGNSWETDDYLADTREEAEQDAADYLNA